MFTPIPISTTPPRISARLPSNGPIKRPIIMPRVAIIMVAQPMAMAVCTMFTCRKARPTPIAMASRLVAMAVATNNQKP
ncbi:hypothetical protein D3C75_1262440 [compost metagenome]